MANNMDGLSNIEEKDVVAVSDKVAKAILPPESHIAFEKMLIVHEPKYGRYFTSRNQYEYFMMLPLNDLQRAALLKNLCPNG